jgi:uncharacterized protein YabN with tetrapyrrole methylase and pyrophosphatase domain
MAEAEDKRASLVVVGTGIQWAGQTTLAAQRAIEEAESVLFAVADPWAARWIQGLHPGAESLPYPQDEEGPRRRIYRAMVERILAELRLERAVCAVFYGHPGVLTEPSHAAVKAARAEGFEARMLPGVSSLDCLYADLGVDPGRDGCLVHEATDFLLRRRSFDPHAALILCQLGLVGHRGPYDRARPERVRAGLRLLAEALAARLPADHPVTIYEAATHPLSPARAETIPLAALPDAEVSEISTLYVPPERPAPIDERVALLLGIELGGEVPPPTQRREKGPPG